MGGNGYEEIGGRRGRRRGFAFLSAVLVAGLVVVTYDRQGGGSFVLSDAKVAPGHGERLEDQGERLEDQGVAGDGLALDGAAALADIAARDPKAQGDVAAVTDVAARDPARNGTVALADAPVPARRDANATRPS